MSTPTDIAQSNGTALPRPNTGPFASEPEALREVLRRLVRDLDPEQVWLFGSRAEGRHRPDSDFDLFVVTRTNSGESGHDHDAVYAPILGLGVGCDVVPCRADDFETARNDRTCLAWHVEHTGKKIYPTDTGRLKRAPPPEDLRKKLEAAEQLLLDAKVHIFGADSKLWPVDAPARKM